MDNIIICPNCGAEYLPAEIYVKNEFFGKPHFICRNSDNKIENIIGKQPDLNETYKCDICDATFNVSCKMQFDTELNEETSMSIEHLTQLFKPLTLSEN